MATCLDDIAVLLQRLATAQENCCGAGSGCAGTTEEEPSMYEDDGVAFPAGYDSHQEYLLNKCQQAERFRLNLLSDVNKMKVGGIASLAATALAVALLTPIPFDDLILLSGVAIAWLVQGLLVGYADELIGYLNSQAGNIRCRLMQATNVAAAIAAVDDDVSLSASASLLLSYFVNNDSLNPLFEFEDNVGSYGVSCTGCICEMFISVGSGALRTDGVQFTVWSAFSSGAWRVNLDLTQSCCSTGFRVHFDDWVGTQTPNNGAGVWTCPGNVRVVNQPTMPGGTWNAVNGVQQAETSGSGDWGMKFRVEIV